VALWIAATTLWTVCWAAPLSTGLHVRVELARPRSIVASDVPRRDPVTALLRIWLLHGLSLTPVAHVPASRGTAEVAAWSPNGQYLAVGYSTGGLLIWDVVHRHLASWAWHAHRRFVNALAWSPHGDVLVSAAPDGQVMLWRLGTRTHGALVPVWVLRSRPHPPYVPAVAMSPTGDRLAIADGLHSVTVWIVARPSRSRGGLVRPRLQRRLRVPGHATAVVWSSDGTRLAAGTQEGQILLWHVRGSRQQVTRALGSHVWALAWSPNGLTLAAGGADGAVCLLAGTDLRLQQRLLAPFQRTPVLQMPDFGLPAQAGKAGQPQLAAGAAINSLGWSPSGDLLAVTATGVPLRLWQPARGRVAATLPTNWDMNAVTWRPDGRLLAVAADDGSVSLLRVAVPASVVTTLLCRWGDARWCVPLLSRQPDSPPGSVVPPSYMSR
jgi:WD40 repeat protein